MSRTLAREVADHIGETVTIRGWLHKKRLMGGLNFITLRDRSGLIQSLIDDKEELEKLRGMQTGTVLALTGTVIADERALGGAELHEVNVQVEVPVTDEPPIEIDKPINHQPENLDTLFEYRVLNLRNIQEQKIFRIRASILRYIREYLTIREFVEIQSPKLQGSSAEGGAEVFKLDYFGKEAALAQSPQLAKQIMVGVFERVFEIGAAYRAEPSSTTRHLTELTMLDVEMGFVDSYDEVLNLIGDMTSTVLRRVYEDHEADMKSLNAPTLVLPENGVIPRYGVLQVHDMYLKATKNDMSQEKDLTPEEERWIGEYARKNDQSDLVYINEFPLATHKFYQKKAEDGKSVLSADLLFRGVEIATSPMRENNYEKLVAQMREKGINPEDPGFKYYLQAFQYGLPAHGGCGFGIDRLVQKAIGLGNVKEATLFPRDINRLTP